MTAPDADRPYPFRYVPRRIYSTQLDAAMCPVCAALAGPCTISTLAMR